MKMKNFFSSIMPIALLALPLVFVSCNKDEEGDDKTPIEILIEQGVLVGNLNIPVALDASKEYKLAGAFIVEAGGELTIPAGTTIKAPQGFGNYILVLQGGKIFANGTADKPVTMTADVANAQKGHWGGLIINGKAPLTSSNLEATTEINSDYKYGGNVADDNSGVLTYLILAYTGARSSADVEHNGLTLNGVGSGTKIENIYIPHTADDGVEFFGGSVNVKNLLVVDSDDDMFDFTQGYNGTLENAYGVWPTGFQSTEADPRGIEADGNFDGNFPNDTHQSDFTVRNVTFDLKLAAAAGTDSEKAKVTMQDVIKVRRGAKATIENALVIGTGTVTDLVDFTDQKGAGDAGSTISLTNSLTNQFTGRAVNPETGYTGVTIAAGNTGCPTNIFAWTGYSF